MFQDSYSCICFFFYSVGRLTKDVSGKTEENMEQENLIEKDLALSVLLPEGHEKTVTVHGR